MIAYDRLSQIIPGDQALAWKAIQVSLQQVKGIVDLELPDLAVAFSGTETTKDLDLISALTEPVPASVQSYYTSSYATGSGPDGTLVITDFLGLPVGQGFIIPLGNTVNAIAELNTVSGLSNLSNIYTRMLNTVNSVYGNASTGPVTIPAGVAAGVYANADVAMTTGLIPNAQGAITTVVSSYPSQVAVMNTAFTSMANTVITENTNLGTAGVSFGNLVAADRSSTLSFVQNLHEYALNVDENGPSQFLEEVANLSNLGGQAVVACLREGRNLAVLNNTGVGQDIAIPSVSTTTANTANLLSSTYTSSEAGNTLVV